MIALSACLILRNLPLFLQPDGEDELKKRQLMELAILNGTYRDAKTIPAVHHIRKWYLLLC